MRNAAKVSRTPGVSLIDRMNLPSIAPSCAASRQADIAFRQHETRMIRHPGIRNGRLAKNHAQLAAMLDAMRLTSSPRSVPTSSTSASSRFAPAGGRAR